MIQIKRVYDPPQAGDGKRILIDRLWPRGLKKDVARIDAWMKDVAPSSELRTWFNHEPGKWVEFKRRFFNELKGKQGAMEEIVSLAKKGTVTLLFGSKETRFNNATALKEYIESKAGVTENRKAA